MSSTASHDDLSLLKTPSRKRTRAPEDELLVNEEKRRRSSLLYGLVVRESTPATKASTVCKDIYDRFLPTLTTTEPFYPINMTSPMSGRLGRALGLVGPRLLSFRDDSPTKHHISDVTLSLRMHLSRSLAVQPKKPDRTYSAAKHGRKKPDRVLDSGPMHRFPLHPCAWSSADIVAAVIRGRVFTHRMDTDMISSVLDCGSAECVEWTSGTDLAIGHSWGATVLLDAVAIKIQRHLLPAISSSETCADMDASDVNALSWCKERGLLAVGRANGSVDLYDPRVDRAVENEPGEPAHAVLGIQWSPDGLYLAAGFKSGIVKCMDWRANKTFDLKPPQRKAAHKSAVKSLTWAPWNPHLLATGGSTSDHTVRIWSISNFDATSSGPVHTLSLSSDISSLHFSPHTTELLSTHGKAASNSSCPHSASHIRRHSMGIGNTRGLSRTEATPTRHALLVHSYPSLRRVHTVLDAHAQPIVDSVLAPNGTRIMTFGEDETLRVWTVWGARKPEKKIGPMNEYMIR